MLDLVVDAFVSVYIFIPEEKLMLRTDFCSDTSIVNLIKMFLYSI